MVDTDKQKRIFLMNDPKVNWYHIIQNHKESFEKMMCDLFGYGDFKVDESDSTEYVCTRTENGQVLPRHVFHYEDLNEQALKCVFWLGKQGIFVQVNDSQPHCRLRVNRDSTIELEEHMNGPAEAFALGIEKAFELLKP